MDEYLSTRLEDTACSRPGEVAPVEADFVRTLLPSQIVADTPRKAQNDHAAFHRVSILVLRTQTRPSLVISSRRDPLRAFAGPLLPMGCSLRPSYVFMMHYVKHERAEQGLCAGAGIIFRRMSQRGVESMSDMPVGLVLMQIWSVPPA